jgi:hypothetical protein
MVKRVLLLALAVCLTAPAIASAQETGSVSGAVFDQTGTPVVDAEVKISGDQMPAGRTVRTDQNGTYNFQRLLPGRYTVQVEKTGVGASTRPVEVSVGNDTQVDMVLGVEVKEELTVTAASPLVDVRSTEVNFNYKADVIESLPLVRNYSGLFQLIPGVAENNSFAPSGGASRQDNKYLMDGVDITNPGFGYLSTEVNDLDIQEFNVKKGAITAEFGRANGFVTNAVSKSGTNQLRGTGKVEMRPKGFNADSQTLNSAGEIVDTASPTDRWLAGFALGGPLVRDRLFWYGSGQYLKSTTSDRTNALGPVPDTTTKTREIFGKVTGQPGGNVFLNAGYRYRPSDCELCGVGNLDSPDVARNTESDNKIATVTMSWFVGTRTALDAKYIHMEENAANLPVRDLGFQPAFNANDLANMGQYTDNTGPVAGVVRGAHNLRSEVVDYKRDEFRAMLTHFFDTGTVGHTLKSGFGLEEGSEVLERKSNGWGILSIVGAGGTQVQATYYPDQPAQVSPGRTYSLFVQDDITISRRLVVNAGLLFNRDEFSQVLADENTFLTFGFGDQIQPRIGVNYQLRKNAGDKIYGNFGRYYNMDQKSSSRSLAPSRLFLNDALFNRATNALISDIPRASTTGKLITEGIDPTHTDEWLVGYATPIRNDWSFDIFFLHRETFDFIEDIPSALPATGPFRAAQLDGAERKFRSLTLELGRRLLNNWSMTASYAWSRLEGNFDLDYAASAVFNTSSAIQDGPGEFVQDPLRRGPLSQDRPHVFKLFGTYNPPVVQNLTLGGYLRAQSGTPWSARGLDWDNGLRRYLEPAGANRNNAWTNVDLLAAYRIRLGGRTNFRVEGRLLNLFNERTALNVDQRQWLDPRVRPTTLAPQILAACGTDWVCATDMFTAVQTTTRPNPRFGLANEWAPPRRFLLTFQVDF